MWGAADDALLAGFGMGDSEAEAGRVVYEATLTEPS